MENKTEEQHQEENNLTEIHLKEINQPKKKLLKSVKNRILFGVCSGLGDFFNIDPIFFRLIFILSLFWDGWGIIIYLILAIVIPAYPRTNVIENEELNFQPDKKFKTMTGSFIILLGVYLLLTEMEFVNYKGFLGLKDQEIITSLILALSVIYFLNYELRTVTDEEPSLYFRNSHHKIIAGVCWGLAGYLRTEIFLIRIFFILFTIITLGTGIIIYCTFILTVPYKTEGEIG
jgi:phage shock protein PspC (stress-responsive transcriptional regulator)